MVYDDYDNDDDDNDDDDDDNDDESKNYQGIDKIDLPYTHEVKNNTNSQECYFIHYYVEIIEYLCCNCFPTTFVLNYLITCEPVCAFNIF